jgi:hypothetical protein
MASKPFEQKVGVDRLIAYPWPHLLLDNFLSSADLAQSLLEISAETYDYDIE